MVIKKKDKEYIVKELKASWKLERTVGDCVSAFYSIPKTLAPDISAVERFVLTHDEIF